MGLLYFLVWILVAGLGCLGIKFFDRIDDNAWRTGKRFTGLEDIVFGLGFSFSVLLAVGGTAVAVGQFICLLDQWILG